MDQPEEELQQIALWLSEEGLTPDAPKEAQLCLLWSALERTRSCLNSVSWDLDTQRSQHLAEMAEVRKSLEQIRIFTEHKDVLAQEIQDENDQLKDQLRHIISLQDSQISEVAKMLYQQGLTELIHSSPSEQVAYLLVERASLMETSEDPNNLTGDGNTARPLGTEAQALNTSAQQSSHKGAPPRHGQSPWKRLFGLHKASQSKHTFIPAEARHLAGQASSVERECSRLERDLEEGSRRLAMAHNEMRRLTDELESAHLTQRAYEPELQAAQQEVEQLRQEVQKLKKYEMVELRKAKELNDRLDLEIRALRSRVRTLDAEKGSLQQTVVSQQEKVERLESALQEQQQLLTVQVQASRAEVVSLQREVQRLEKQQQLVHANQTNDLAKSQAEELSQSNQTCRNLQEELTAQKRCLLEKEETVVSLQREVERLESALQEQQQQLLTVQVQAYHANELAKSQATELIQSNEICRELQNKLSAQSRCLLETESEIHSLKQQLDTSHNDLDNLVSTICTKENNLQDQKLWNQKEQQCENTHCQLKADKELQTQLQLLQNKENTLRKKCPDYQEAAKTLLATQDECETLKKEICETLKCLDKERSKYHEMKEKHKVKLCRAKQKCDDETTWRDEKIKHLERELSLCSHSVAKEKELTISITEENEKLLVERRRLLQQLNEEEHSKKDSHLTASLSKCRVDFLEMENKKLGNKILHMSHQLAVLERSLQNMQSLHFAEELKKTSNIMQVYKSLPVQTSSVTKPELCEIQGLLDDPQSKQTDVASSPHCFISGPPSRSAEMGYLNLTSAQGRPDPSAPPAAISSSDSLCS
ncbi:coiled-coil domain-containing protein 30 isoform X1 [Sebastes umbrosus]|uniref:coiled-coil domain-containing protein 30 isoform X1 n=1 Tax=Sebastes umbrosus TaxID=72105 RepID=UPI00189DC505|nr:coiled-coil domain-containing protein 30 isoform X1 [Sebastes umbrosus]